MCSLHIVKAQLYGSDNNGRDIECVCQLHHLCQCGCVSFLDGGYCQVGKDQKQVKWPNV